jgi:hypothetical protein
MLSDHPTYRRTKRDGSHQPAVFLPESSDQHSKGELRAGVGRAATRLIQTKLWD